MYLFEKNILFVIILSLLFIQAHNGYSEGGNESDKKIGKICNIDDNSEAYILHKDKNQEDKIKHNDPLFYNDNIETKGNDDNLTLSFPFTDCAKSTVDIKVNGRSNIILEEPSDIIKHIPFKKYIIPFITKGTVRISKKYDEKQESEGLYVKTDRIHILVKGSDFLIIENKDFTIVMINDQITKLEVTHIKCGGVHTLNAMGEYRFTDDCQMSYQKKTEKEINQILHELDFIPPDTLKDDNIAEEEVSDIQEKLNDEQNENVIKGYKPVFPTRPIEIPY